MGVSLDPQFLLSENMPQHIVFWGEVVSIMLNPQTWGPETAFFLASSLGDLPQSSFPSPA
jgi:hypothetical protein